MHDSPQDRPCVSSVAAGSFLLIRRRPFCGYIKLKPKIYSKIVQRKEQRGKILKVPCKAKAKSIIVVYKHMHRKPMTHTHQIPRIFYVTHKSTMNLLSPSL